MTDPTKQPPHQSEDRFRLLVDGVLDYAIIMLDPGGRVVSWNSGAEQITGWAAHELIGEHFSRLYLPEAVSAGWPRRELQLATRDGRFEEDGWRRRRDGTMFWANVVLTALHERTGQPRGFAHVMRDLTQRRQLERSRAHAEALAEIDRGKGDFLAMLSHELRNPLAPILNAVHLLRLDRQRDPHRDRAVAVIERQVGRLARLVDDLLEVSRMATGKVALRLTDLDARTLVERAVADAQPLFAQRQLELASALPDAPIWVHADAKRLEQVLAHLLGNAAQYTEAGGHVSVGLGIEDHAAVLRVTDDGIGIPAELLPQIFDAFTQADRSLHRSAGGLGIGLTIVRRIVEMHGGQVDAFSRADRPGSEFVVRLPIAQSPGTPSRATSAGATQGDQQMRVLVVDDNKDAADTSALLLQRLGHDVRVAYAGHRAVELALEFLPDVVLLDIGLPEIDGYEVARRLRQSPDLAGARLIAVTGYGQPGDRARSHQAGFDAHMVKPLDPRRLGEVLARSA